MSNSQMALPSMQSHAAAQSFPSTWVCPEFKVSGIFSSHMVLQRNKPIRVWGFSAAPGSVVSGAFMNTAVQTIVSPDNTWTLIFPAQAATRDPQVMTISDDRGHSVTFGDILVGDVWIVGGQSNAELHLESCLCKTPNLVFDENENFRLFFQAQAYAAQRKDLCAEPQPDIIHPDWCWKKPDRAASVEFSAIGWYFAREVSQHIDVPLGMVMAAMGGACLREIVPEDMARAEGYVYGGNVQIGGYYNTLIHPLEGLQFTAMLFFQGESEAIVRRQADNYDHELALMVYDERHRFGFSFPFYNVQLSNYPKDGPQCFRYADIVRAKQLDAANIIRDYALAVDMDLGAPEDHPDWAHSPFKAELGRRLALLALAREYGVYEEDQISSPAPVQAILSEDGKTIVITFKNTVDGLKAGSLTPEESIGAVLPGFSCGPYETRIPASATITSANTVTVQVPDGADASQVGYAFFVTVTPENANLANSISLPCPAFLLPVKKAEA